MCQANALSLTPQQTNRDRDREKYSWTYVHDHTEFSIIKRFNSLKQYFLTSEITNTNIAEKRLLSLLFVSSILSVQQNFDGNQLKVNIEEAAHD